MNFNRLRLPRRRAFVSTSAALLALAFLRSALPSLAAEARFEREILAFEAADKTNPPPKDCTLFVGASNIRLWKNLADDVRDKKAVNRGFGGSQISDVVTHLDRIVTPYAPKTIYLQSGGNDINAGKSPEQVLADFKEFVTKVRAKLPEVKLNFVGLGPSLARWSQRAKQIEANRLIESFCREDGHISFINVFPHMLGDDGKPRPELYVTDNLHLSAKGQSLWATLIKWDGALKGFAASEMTNPPPQDAILFIGSSSIVKWKSLAHDFPDHRCINRGFGGSFLSDSANLVHSLVLPLHPKQIIVYAGGNDINGGRAPEQVLSSFQLFVEKVHAKQPETPVAFISVAPNPARWSQIEKVKAANQLVADFCKNNPRLTFINVFPKMLGEDGQPKPDIFVEDRLHMNEKGYAIWREVVGPYLK